MVDSIRVGRVIIEHSPFGSEEESSDQGEPDLRAHVSTGGMAGRHPFSWPPSAGPTIAEDVEDLSIGGRTSEGGHRSDRSGVPARPP